MFGLFARVQDLLGVPAQHLAGLVVLIYNSDLRVHCGVGLDDREVDQRFQNLDFGALEGRLDLKS